jgi:catalase
VVDADLLIDDILADFPSHRAGTRPVHAHGIGVVGTFRASDVASRYCRAAHFSGQPIEVTARFSNGSGQAVQRDSASDVRGMAVRFHLNGRDHSAHTDLVAMTLPVFFVPTIPDFRAFTAASVPRPRPKRSVLQFVRDTLLVKPPIAPLPPGETASGDLGTLAYADAHSFACPAVVGLTAAPPSSYLGCTFHAVHAFKLTDADGGWRYVRFFWEPEAPERPYQGNAEVYLFADLRRRVAEHRANFVLRAQVAEAGDDLTDPTRAWSAARKRLVMGRLMITGLVADQEVDCEAMGFDPCHLTPGITLSEDPILHARRAVYARSQARRLAARIAGTP